MARLNKEQKEQMRLMILEQSNLLFNELGYDKTSISKIAREVGIAEGTIFNYFESKADIFMEVITRDFHPIGIEQVADSGQGVCDIVYEFLYSNFKSFIKMPKKLLRDMAGATVSIAKKKPQLFKSMAEMDYKMLVQLEALLIKLNDKGLLKSCDFKVLAECIYSVLMFEFLLYVYENDRSKNVFLENIQGKIAFVLSNNVVI